MKHNTTTVLFFKVFLKFRAKAKCLSKVFNWLTRKWASVHWKSFACAWAHFEPPPVMLHCLLPTRIRNTILIRQWAIDDRTYIFNVLFLSLYRNEHVLGHLCIQVFLILFSNNSKFVVMKIDLFSAMIGALQNMFAIYKINISFVLDTSPRRWAQTFVKNYYIIIGKLNYYSLSFLFY